MKRGEEDGEVYSYVDTTRRDAFAKTHGGRVERIHLYGVQYVMTVKEKRREWESLVEFGTPRWIEC